MAKVEKKTEHIEEKSDSHLEDLQKNEQEPAVFVNETGPMVNSKALHAGQGMYIQAKD